MTAHDQTLLGPYVLGVLEPAEARQVEDHLAGCPECRQQLAELEETRSLLGDVPPEAFLDGPPADGDLLLQRTLRAARALDDQPSVGATPPRVRWLRVAGAAAVVATMALGGGVLIGRQTVGDTPAPAPTVAPVAGSRHAAATDRTTGTTMATTVEPRAGWSWVNVRLTGLEAGAECELIITDTAGRPHVAGSWVVSKEAARNGSPFSGGVQVPIDRVASVEVKDSQGRHVVTTKL
jgi:hypothetical protein